METYIRLSEAIERINDLVDSMSVCISTDECHGMKSMKARVLTTLYTMPAADVVPVVRGEWIWPVVRGGPYCSRCLNDAFWDADHGFVTGNFCPNCGADMRGGRNNE